MDFVPPLNENRSKQLPVELPPGIETKRILPRTIALVVLVFGFSISLYGALFVRNTGVSAKTFIDPFLTTGSVRWAIAKDGGFCVGNAGSRFRERSAQGHSLRARFWLDPELPPLKLSVRFSDYRLLEEIHLDATFPEEQIVIRSRPGSSVLGYRITPRLDPTQPVEHGEIRLPQPILLNASADERSFELNIPPILNQYLGMNDAEGQNRFRFTPGTKSNCGVSHTDIGIVRSMIRKFITEFAVKGGA